MSAALRMVVVFVVEAADASRAPIVPGLICWTFFFSSRRRHTRSDRDWSSDVCSSDLNEATSEIAIVYFRFPLRNFFFWMIFVTLMLPVEVRIIPTYKVVSDLGILNSYVGLTLPLIASATATFLFRQFFLTIPEELAEASRIDGAGPMRFFFDVVLPLSKTSMAALFVIQFIYGWNQYLWPLLVTTDESMYTVVIGIKRMILGGDALTEWNVVMATAMLALLPPAAVVVLMQKWFVKGLVETEK